jgi:predicted NUDIX family NTP pyrophosphohydrolase
MHEVVVGALVREGRVLLVHRRPDKHANPDVWDLPGGLIEGNESQVDALARELREELGVQIATASASQLWGSPGGRVTRMVLASAPAGIRNAASGRVVITSTLGAAVPDQRSWFLQTGDCSL